MKYWDIMTPTQRSEEMKRRRSLATKPAGGLSYVDKQKRAEIMQHVRSHRLVEQNGKKQTEDSSRPS